MICVINRQTSTLVYLISVPIIFCADSPYSQCNSSFSNDPGEGPSLRELIMGKLSDITANASNTGVRLSAVSMGYQSLNSTPPSENLGKKAPRFMSPTVSSTKQGNAKSLNIQGNVSTPLASSAKARASGNWMASAAKRVGFNRTSDGTPRPKKEGFLKQPKAISFPDKVRQ